jgi:hypothetical protein
MSKNKRSDSIGSLIRTTIESTLEQASVVRDVLERGAKSSRERLDEVRSDRKRSTVLAELGAVVLDLIRRGEIDVAELPEIAPLVAQLDEIDGDEAPAPRSIRTSRRADGELPIKDRRTEVRADVRGAQRVWRPPVDDDTTTLRMQRDADGTISALRSVAPIAVDPVDVINRARGGISFDDDLADYMNPNDVPDKK